MYFVFWVMYGDVQVMYFVFQIHNFV